MDTDDYVIHLHVVSMYMERYDDRCGSDYVTLYDSRKSNSVLLYFHCGFVHPLQDVALRQCLPFK